MKKPIVLISGCSTGIGHDLALEFERAGALVCATARNKKVLDPLSGKNIRIYTLDVTDPVSIKKCVSQVLRENDRIDILVNNAGYGLMGPVAEITIEDLRKQFETNLIGLVALSQAVLPGMIERKNGRIINISSVSGILTSPFAGAYCSSKAALNSLSDAMRIELAPFGIKVFTVQPGAIQSRFGATALNSLDPVHKKESVYAGIQRHIDRRAMTSQENPTPSGIFAKMLVKKIFSRNPPAVIRLGNDSHKLPLFKALFPGRILDRILSKKFGLDELK